MRGLVGTCGREGLWCCGYMGLGPVAHRSLKETYGMENRRALLIGSILSGSFESSFFSILLNLKGLLSLHYLTLWILLKLACKVFFLYFHLTLLSNY